MDNNVLLSPSNCRCSPAMHPWLLSSVRERRRWRDGGGFGGLEGVYCWKKPVDLSAGIFSPPNPPLNETHNKAASVCVVSSSIHAHPQHPPYTKLPPSPSISPALSVWSRMPLKNYCSQSSPPLLWESVNIFNSICLWVCLHMFN